MVAEQVNFLVDKSRHVTVLLQLAWYCQFLLIMSAYPYNGTIPMDMIRDQLFHNLSLNQFWWERAKLAKADVMVSVSHIIWLV